MTANATIQTKELNQVLVVPTQAIQTDEGSEAITYVEKLDEQGNVMRVEVDLGLRSGSVREVVAGLEEGDRVIIRQQVEMAAASRS
jgi:multidrug efflux pump subunit AcrA (membrane-fusion protein)